MARKATEVMGVTAPAPRLTRAGALWLAGVLALPVATLLALAELVWRWLGG